MNFDLTRDKDFLAKLRQVLTQWGITSINSASHANDICCPEYRSESTLTPEEAAEIKLCGLSQGECIKNRTYTKWASALIGFSREIQWGIADNYVGTLIFECPVHHVRFWIHLRGEWIEEYISKCTHWPKTDLEIVRDLVTKEERLRKKQKHRHKK